MSLSMNRVQVLVHPEEQHLLGLRRGGGAGGAEGAIAPPNISVGEQRSPNISQALFCIYRTAKEYYLCLLWGTDSKR